MAIRKILFVVAVVVALIGASQLVFAGWWVDRVPEMVLSDSFYLWGLPGLLFGIVLLIGVMERAVGLRPFLAVVSLFSIASGGVLLVQPQFTRDVVETLFLLRSHVVQTFDMWLVGLIRVAIGMALLYALIRREVREAEPEAGQPFEPGPMEQ